VSGSRNYLYHILDAIEKIGLYTQQGQQAFFDDEKTQDAVIRKFEIIGEATKRLDDETKSQKPQIDWRSVAGLRDVLIHNYMGVNLSRVWGVIERDLPPLQQAIQELILEQ